MHNSIPIAGDAIAAIGARRHRHLVQLSHSAQLGDGRFHDVDGIQGRDLKLDLSGLDLLEIENVID